jgi:hypothetical protein
MGRLDMARAGTVGDSGDVRGSVMKVESKGALSAQERVGALAICIDLDGALACSAPPTLRSTLAALVLVLLSPLSSHSVLLPAQRPTAQRIRPCPSRSRLVVQR